MAVGAAAAAAGVGTTAYFSDSESSDNNTITAGTLELTGAASGAFSVSNVVPGQRIPDSGTNTIEANYDSGSSIDPAEVDFSASIAEPSGEPTEPGNSSNQSASAFAQQLTVESADLLVNGSSVNDLTSTQSVATVDDLSGLSLDDAFGDVSPGDTVALDLAVTFDSGAGNEYQADGVALTAQFTAEQPSADP